MTRFAVVDVETANSDAGSICQIGVAVFDKGQIVKSWQSLINPKAEFDLMNIFIHSIDADSVLNAPTMQDIKPKLQELFEGAVVCSYSSFDKRALIKHFDEFATTYQWLDILRVVRKTWYGKFSSHNYGLANACEELGIELGDAHHNAEADALAAGGILLIAQHETGKSLPELIEMVKYRPPKLATRKEQIINDEGDYIGSVCVFTGELSLVRSEATRLANEAGFAVAPSVTKKTTHLIIGTQTAKNLAGDGKSSKELKALELVKKGQNIVFLSEEDFFEIIRSE